MSGMVDGKWVTTMPAAEEIKGGKFVRMDSLFRDAVSADPAARYPAEAGRYHLWVAWGCPWAARTLAPWVDRLQPVRSEPARRFGYRDRVTLNARWDVDAGWRFGLMRRDELIAIHDCPVHTPRVNRLVQCLRAHAPPADVLPLAYLHVAGAQATLIVKARQVERERLEDVVAHVAATGVEGLWLHLHPSAGRKLFARSGWHLLCGVPRSIGPDATVHGPTAFQQLLPDLHATSLEVAAEFLAPRPGAAVLDLVS